MFSRDSFLKLIKFVIPTNHAKIFEMRFHRSVMYHVLVRKELCVILVSDSHLDCMYLMIQFVIR